MEESLQEALSLARLIKSRQDIVDQCHRYCRALDHVDEALLRSVFHPDSTHEHGPFRGASAEFCSYAIEVVRSLNRTQHFLGNITLDLEGDVAHVESYFLAYHRLPKGSKSTGVFQRHDPSIDEDVFIGGRYIDRFELRDGEWKIARRIGLNEWELWAPSTSVIRLDKIS